MSKKVIKYILEMIFIFIIPLLFMLLGIEIKKVYTYDENNNVVSEEKLVDIKELDFINDETLNLYIQSISNTFTSTTLNTIENKTIYINLDDLTYNQNDDYYVICSFDDKGDTCEIVVSGVDYSIKYLVWGVAVNPYVYELNGSYEYNNESYLFYNEVNWSTFVGFMNRPDSIEFYENNDIYINQDTINYTLYTTIQENVFSRALNTLFDSLGIENNIIIQLVVIYFILWLIMFILWHIFYLPFDKLFHLRKE